MKTLLVSSFFLIPAALSAQPPGANWIVPPLPDSLEIVECSPGSADQRVVVKKNGRLGLCNRKGELLTPIRFSRITLLDGLWVEAWEEIPNPEPGSPPLRKVLLNDKLEVVSRPYDSFRRLPGGFALVSKAGLNGIINLKGEEVAPVEYQTVRENPPEYTFFKGEQYRKFVFPAATAIHPELEKIAREKAGKLLPGYVHFEENGRNGFTNARGDTVVPPRYPEFGPIHPKGYILATLDKKNWGVIDPSNKTLFPFTASHKGAWTKSGLLPLKVDGAWGLVRFPAGETVIPFGMYKSIKNFDDALDRFEVDKDGLVGVIDARGQFLLQPEYAYIAPGWLVTISISKNGMSGYWYPPKNVIVPPQYHKTFNMNDSLIIVRKDSLWAVIDVKTGKEIIPFSTFQIDVRGPYFLMSKKYENSPATSRRWFLHGLTDRNGKVVFEPDSAEVHVFPDSSYYVAYYHKNSRPRNEHYAADGRLLRTLQKVGTEVRGKYWFGVTEKDDKGISHQLVFSCFDPPGQEQRYHFIGKLVENVRVVKRDEKYGLVSDEGKLLLPLEFDAIVDSKDGYIRAKYKGNWGVLQNPLFDFWEEKRK